MKRNIGRRTVYSLFISLSLIFFLIVRVGVSNLIDSISRVDIPIFVFACLIALPNNATRSFRWSRVLKAQKINLPPVQALKYFLMGLYAAVLTPGRVGDLLRSYLISRREKTSFGFITASVVFDRMLDLGTMLTIATLGVLIFFTPEQWETMSNALVLLVVFALLGVFLVYIVFSTDFGKQFLSKFGTAFIRLLPKSFAEKIDIDNELNDFFEAIDLYRSNYTNLVFAAILSVFAWLIYGFQGYVLFLAYGSGQSASVWVIVFLIAFGAFATLIPFTISGLGAREAIFVAFLSAIGIAEADALSFSILFYAIGAWVPAIFGGILLGREGISRREITNSQNSE